MCQISSLMAATEGPVAEFSSFANFEERERKSNLLMSFPKIVHQKRSFGQKKKKSVISLLSADSQYSRTYALQHMPKRNFKNNFIAKTSLYLINFKINLKLSLTFLVFMTSLYFRILIYNFYTFFGGPSRKLPLGARDLGPPLKIF